MKLIRSLISLLIIICFKTSAQNLVLNPSFSEVRHKTDTTLFYRLLPGDQSEIKNWYLPGYINYRLNTDSNLSISGNENSDLGMYGKTEYFTSRDKDLIPKDRKDHPGVNTNAEQIFENNMGFVHIRNTGRSHAISIIQQKLAQSLKAGNYCLKFRYKYLHYSASYKRPPSLDFAFSDSDLRQYYTDEAIKLPEHLVKLVLKTVPTIQMRIVRGSKSVIRFTLMAMNSI